VTILGRAIPLFDVGAWIGAAGLLITATIAAVRHTRELYLAEPLPDAARAVQPKPAQVDLQLTIAPE
jgi:hypothetical protein